MRAVVYTHSQDRVAVCHPDPVFFAGIQHGGVWSQASRVFCAEQVDRQVASGIPEVVAVRAVDAMARGGLSEAEAWGLLRDRDCWKGVAHEVVDIADLPSRLFRDCWRRGHNGGPVTVDLDAAKSAWFARLRKKVKLYNSRRADQLVPGPLLRPSWGRLRDRIAAARAVEALEAITIPLPGERGA